MTSKESKEAKEAALAEIKVKHDRLYGPIDWSIGKFTVRQWDGMDGCWCDHYEATNVSAQKALAKWNEETAGGTRKVSFNEIDYYRIFPADTRMHWDGKDGMEMFR